MHRALVLSGLLAMAGCGKEPADISAGVTEAHVYRMAARVDPSRPALEIEKCRSAGTPHGEGHVKITYGPDGRPFKAEVDDPVFANTHTGWCVADRFLQIAKLDPMKYGSATADGSFTF